jgi:hypothetical protein
LGKLIKGAGKYEAVAQELKGDFADVTREGFAPASLKEDNAIGFLLDKAEELLWMTPRFLVLTGVGQMQCFLDICP